MLNTHKEVKESCYYPQSQSRQMKSVLRTTAHDYNEHDASKLSNKDATKGGTFRQRQ